MDSNGFLPENTMILEGVENGISYGTKIFHNAQKVLDIWSDKNGPSVAIEFPVYKDNFIKTRERGVKIRFIVEVTKDNLQYCKELINCVDELRHLDGLKGAMAVSESEFVATSVLKEKQYVTQFLYSNKKDIVEQQQYIFDTFWKHSVSADLKITELVEGHEPIKTEIIEDVNEISKRIIKLAETSNEMHISSTIGGMRLIYQNYFELYKNVMKKQRNGKHNGIRWMVSISSNEDIQLIQRFLDEGIKVRHTHHVPNPSFALSDKMLNSTIERMEDGVMVNNLLSSNDHLYLDHYNTIFEDSWHNAIDAEDRINDIQKGYYSSIKVIPNPKESLQLISDMRSLVKNEVLIIVPSENGILRIESSNGFEALNDIAMKGIKVKVLYAENSLKMHEYIDNVKSKCSFIQFRRLLSTFQHIMRITILDREKTILIEIKDDTKQDYTAAMGLSLLIDSKSTAQSYASVFDNLWNQSEMYEQLQMAYDNLKQHEIRQQEFIDIVAHELRGPLTPIIGLAEYIRDETINSDQKKLLNIVINNSKRLRLLIEKILDVTRIDGKLYTLEITKFSINQLIIDIIKQFENHIKESGNTLHFKYDNDFCNKDYLINADRVKIEQVISNLIENSIKFQSDKGAYIFLRIEQKELIGNTDLSTNKKPFVLVSVIDNGKGIDAEILPRLFTKFASKSFHGTGLGLYLSRNIIEAHGGKIWGTNNSNGKGGATFSFSLPLADSAQGLQLGR
ncbi:sensor histidine kinase [Candidatus Nitrosocosmicus hydrocola]|uniref:sensor histidine kinase n=1 Tax=Candidatus Nitrosocosmicus hydrocola TaxID=1826872 RepID=UPI0011E59483|nr:HAMP domain-containing sensor histidine kinase [Candidatus Nitrosocosmicus hydrocola]